MSDEEGPTILEAWDTVSGAGPTFKTQFFYMEEEPVKDEEVSD